MENVNQKTTLTEQQSLELITRMISDTRTRLARNSGAPFLIWGYATVAVAIFEYFVQSTFTDPAPWLWAWWAIPVIGIVGMLLFARRDTGAKNYLDRTVSAVWAVCSISILTVAIPLSVFYHVSMLFSVVVLIGIGTTITGRIIRDTTTSAAGFLFTLSALIYPAAQHPVRRDTRRHDSGRDALAQHQQPRLRRAVPRLHGHTGTYPQPQNKPSMFKELNPLLHSELRLAVMSILISAESADFVYLRERTGATAGNLSVQIDKLHKAGYITVTKSFKGKMPCTTCAITPRAAPPSPSMSTPWPTT